MPAGGFARLPGLRVAIGHPGSRALAALPCWTPWARLAIAALPALCSVSAAPAILAGGAPNP